MRILGIDTVTQHAAVALLCEERCYEQAVAWRSAFREIAPATERLLEVAGLEWEQLDGIAVPAGPGSFTGLRVGAAFAIAIADMRGIDLFGPPSLAIVAAACAAPGSELVCATMDARRGRRYAALCVRSGDGWAVSDGPFDLMPDEVPDLAGEAPIVGLEGARPGGPSFAAAMAGLAAVAPDLYRSSVQGLDLTYVRPAVSSG